MALRLKSAPFCSRETLMVVGEWVSKIQTNSYSILLPASHPMSSEDLRENQKYPFLTLRAVLIQLKFLQWKSPLGGAWEWGAQVVTTL